MRAIPECLLDELFPFGFTIDRRLVITRTGPSLARLVASDMVGAALGHHFRVLRPGVTSTYERLEDHLGMLCVIECPRRDVVLRGQLQQLEDGELTFMVSPWITRAQELVRLGLKLDDFAAHDPVTDVLQVLQTQRQANDDLQRLTTRLRRRSDELKGMVEEREVARAQAERANRAMSSFLAVMSHEIRTPLNGILGLTEILGEELERPEQRDVLSKLHDSGIMLMSLVEDVLDFSKIEAGRLEIARQDFAPRACISEATNVVSVRAASKGLRVHVHIDDDVPLHVSGDPARLRQVLVNLLTNAVKYTDCGEVTVVVEASTTAEGHCLEVDVKDTGLGIPAEARERLFLPFHQLHGDEGIRRGGAGLGLAITRRLVEAMGGEIAVESSPGLGSTFSFQVKVGRAAPAAVDLRERRSAGLVLPRVLVAEDNAVNKVVIRRLLDRLGVDVDVVDDGAMALEAMDRREYDLVFFDVQMPVLDGISAARRLRQREGPQPWCIALTASAAEDDRRQCLAAGMNDFLTKPISRQALSDAIDRWRVWHAPAAAAGS